MFSRLSLIPHNQHARLYREWASARYAETFIHCRLNHFFNLHDLHAISPAFSEKQINFIFLVNYYVVVLYSLYDIYIRI